MAIPETSTPRSTRLAFVPTECAFLKADLGLAAAIADDHADDVEAARWRPVAGQSADVAASHRTNVFLLVQVNRGRGWGEIGAGPRLHLDEAQHSVIPANQVNLTAVIRNAEVRRHHSVAELPQVEVRFDFTALAGQQVLRRLRRKCRLARSRLRMTNWLSQIIGPVTNVLVMSR